MYDSLITNTSKSMMCFSDFPCPPDYPPYLPHQLYEQYLHSYAEHFKLHQHIKFNTKVRFCYFSWTLQQNFEQWTFTKMSDWPLGFIRVSFLLGLHCSQIQLLFHSVPTSLGDRNDCCQHGIADNATFFLVAMTTVGSPLLMVMMTKHFITWPTCGSIVQGLKCMV